MKKQFLTASILLLLITIWGCQKQQEFEELPITIQPRLKGIDPGNSDPISIYPNPFSNEFMLGGSNITEIRISDEKGRMYKSDLEGNGFAVDCSACEPGVYYLELLVDGTVTRMRLWKNQ